MITLELSMNGEAVGKLEVDPALISRLMADGPSHAHHAHPPRPIVSSALSTAEAAALVERLDKTTIELLRRLAASEGALTWGEAKTLFGLRDYGEFAEGPGHEIAKAVRHVLHDRSARLVWRNEHEWEGLSKGEDEACWLHVDGQALRALQAVFGT